MIRIAIVITISLTSHAAVRSVSFLGTQIQEIKNPNTMERVLADSKCTITVVNTSSSAQAIVSVLGLREQSATLSVGAIQDSPATRIALRNPASTCGGSHVACLGPAGLAVFSFDQVAKVGTGTSLVSMCSGKITVADATPTDTGSIIAQGALLSFRESIVVDGVLSGAMYVNGNYSAHDSLVGEVGYTENMNFGCYEGCKSEMTGMPLMSSSAVALNCSFLCSGLQAPLATDYSRTEGSISRLISADANRVQSSTLSQLEEFINRAILMQSNSSVQGASPSELLRIRQVGGDDLPLRGLAMRGGKVMEFVSGPFRRICNANRHYSAEGGVGFRHSRSGAGATGGTHPYDSERLECQHRHGFSDLTLEESTSTPIVINGGMAF